MFCEPSKAGEVPVASPLREIVLPVCKAAAVSAVPAVDALPMDIVPSGLIVTVSVPLATDLTTPPFSVVP